MLWNPKNMESVAHKGIRPFGSAEDATPRCSGQLFILDPV